MDFSVPPPNMRVGPVAQNKFANLNQRVPFQPHQPRPNGVKLPGAVPPPPPHTRNLSFTPGSQIMIQPSNFPTGLVQPHYRPLQQVHYQAAQYPVPAPAPVYQYQPQGAPASQWTQPRYPLNMPVVPGASYQLVAPGQTSPNNNNLSTFQPPPGFTFPPQPSVYNCPPPTYQGPSCPPVLMQPSPSPSPCSSLATSELPDLRHQFLSTQFAGKPGQMIFLPPLSADRSVQTIQVLSPLPGGQFSVQTIVLPIMKVENTNQVQQTNSDNNNSLPPPASASSQEESEDVMLNELDGTGLPKVMQGIDLDQVKQFAAEFKAARLSLGLTQTQVGQALNSSVVEGEESISVSQSTICRFEKLEITALQVKKLLPALRSWLDWAKQRQSQGLPVILSEGADQNRDVKKRKKRTVFNKDTQRVLSEEFEQNSSPSSSQLSEMADRLRLDRETVRVWFCNKRQTIKKQESS